MSDDLKRTIIDAFASQLPETARVMDPASVCEEIEAVPPCTEEEDLPPQETYDRYEATMDDLVADGVLVTGEVLGMKAYTLTKNWRKKAGR